MKEKKKLIPFIDFILRTFKNLSFIVLLKGIQVSSRILPFNAINTFVFRNYL